MIQFDVMGPPEIYPLVPVELPTSLNYRNKIRISLVIVGCTLLLIVTMIVSLAVFKRYYQQKQTTTTTTTMTKGIEVLTTVSTPTTEVLNISNNAQCPASNCPDGATCCLTNKMWTNIRCCLIDIPVCCSPDQGWCCHIHAPVCCGNFGCCPRNRTCCKIQEIEQCCPISDNASITTISTTVK